MLMGFLAMTIVQLIETVYLGMVGRDDLAAIAFTFPVIRKDILANDIDTRRT